MNTSLSSSTTLMSAKSALTAASLTAAIRRQFDRIAV